MTGHVIKKGGARAPSWTEQARAAAGYVYDNRKVIKDTYTKAKKMYHENKPKRGLPPTEAYMHSRHPKRGGQARAVKNWQGVTGRTASVMTTGKKAIIKKAKHVRVPKKLRMQVKEINEAAKIHGTYRSIGYGGITLPASYYQTVCTMGQSLDSSGAGSILSQPFGDQFAFNPEVWIHMLSVLFNGKPDGTSASATNRSAQATGSLLLKPGLSGAPGNLGVGGQAVLGSGLKFHVKKSWESYIMKNLSQRTIEVDMYECAPKVIGAEFGGVLQVGGAGRFAPIPAVDNPILAFDRGMTEEFKMGTRIDIGNARTYGAVPYSPAFKKQYNVTKTSIIMEPGQSHTYLLRGPSDLDVSVDKLVMPADNINQGLFNIQKYSRAMMFVLKVDIEVGYTSAGTNVTDNIGRWGPNTNNVANVLGIERTQYASFDMPEQAGMIVQNSATVGPVSLYNNYRRPVIYEIVYQNSVANSGTARIDENIPTVTENNP